MPRRNEPAEPEELLWPHEKKCLMCGKIFCVLSLESWFYKKNEAGKKTYLCSYTCWRDYQSISAVQMQGRKNEARQQLILKMIRNGMSATEISRALGISIQLVSYYTRKERKKDAGRGERDLPAAAADG